MKRYERYTVTAEWDVEVDDPKTQDARDAVEIAMRWVTTPPDRFKVRPCLRRPATEKGGSE